jgi:predicted nuclease of predicted toxin-antitoxin system
VRFLLDQNISVIAADPLREGGHDSVHVRDLDLQRATDQLVLEAARSQDRILISSDTDFGQLLAGSTARKPSVILLRHRSARDAAGQANLVLANLDQVAADLDAGAIVVIEDLRVRVRRLPFIWE